MTLPVYVPVADFAEEDPDGEGVDVESLLEPLFPAPLPAPFPEVVSAPDVG